MRIVKLTRDMRPYRQGQDAVLPDELAAKLVEKGDAEDSRPYPPVDVAPRVPVGEPPPKTLTRPRPYFTRKRG
jgi:hypothetical protein